MSDYIEEHDDRVVVMNACLMNLPGTANLIGRGRTTCVALLESLENAGYVIVPNPDNDPVAMLDAGQWVERDEESTRRRTVNRWIPEAGTVDA